MGDVFCEEKFNFPGTPYDVQRQLMRAIYDTIENRGVGLFESPTGTGKTLSMICAALTWLQRNRVATSLEEIGDDEPAWVGEQALSQAERQSKEKLWGRAQAYRLRVRNVAKNQSTHASRCVHRHRYEVRDDSADLFAGIDDIDGDYNKCGGRAGARTAERNYGSFSRKWVSDDCDSSRFSKVIFATRTHSQLAQFVNELRKTQFNPPSVSEALSRLTNSNLESFDNSTGNCEPDLPFALVLFGSRQQMCINEDVRKLSSGSAIAERCRELLEGSDKSKRNSGKRGSRGGRCMYHDEESEELLKENLLVGAHEIEDVSKLGRVLGGCPYFATRSAMTDKQNHVDIIGVPYSAILHESTRDAIGISVDEDTVVIFDEGHNVCGAMREVYDCSLDDASLNAGSRLLEVYSKRYFARLSPQSLFRVRQLLTVVEGLASVLKKCMSARVSRMAEIAFDGGIDNVNLFDVIGFLRESGLSKKIRGLAEEEGRDGEEKQILNVAKESISKLQRFLEAMCECGEYGRIAIYPGIGKASNEGRLHHFVVDCGELFAKAVGKARSVLLLGGTLSPRQVLKDTLLSDMMRRRQQTDIAGRSRVDVTDVVEFECDHVVQRENVLSRVCPKSPSGTLLEFTYESRGRLDVLDGLGETVLESIRKVDGGVVVFFASYELLRLVTNRWATTGIIKNIGSVKPTVIEERGTNLAWNSYEKHVEKDKKKGAILLAVMGGKLSEGINFSDELGRVVMVVGMPFANMDNVETQERLKAITNGCPSKKRQLMESECMTIVNQSIGRAVRHANDFAAVLLIDSRFGRQSVLDKLPGFIKRDVRVAQSLAHICDDLNTFFLTHR